jgi:type IV pilus assembly protein PilB
MNSRIIEIIRKANIIAKDAFARAVEISQRDNIPLALFLLKNGIIEETLLMQTLSQSLGGLEIVSPHEMDIEPQIIACVPKDIAIQNRIIPLNRAANNLFIATGDPTNLEQLDLIASKLGNRLRCKLASELSIQQALEKYYFSLPDEKKEKLSTPGLSSEQSEGYVISYIERLMQAAAMRKASDIHIEPFESSLRVRIRIDGSLVEYEQKPRFETKDALLSRVKIVAGLDISEKRLPQDGNAKLDIPNFGKMDFRVSSLPTVYGEKIVLRILDKSNLQLDMTKLGFENIQLQQFKESILKAFGMVIVTGPTGSGKTTTLYSALNELNRLADNVITAEDPVEFTIPGINQVHVRPDINFTFATALKAFLRQDPDVIMIGEIRDAETAEIGMKAALTGHIVLSTLHTNNAPESIERLKNLGIQPFTLISAVNCVVAQRLVRKICVHCKEEANVPLEEQISLGLPEKFAGQYKIYKGKGCDVCHGTGYKGRSAIYEVMVLNDTVKKAIADNLNSLELKLVAMQNGMQTLRQSAWKKVLSGQTTIEEMLEASNPDQDLTKQVLRRAA